MKSRIITKLGSSAKIYDALEIVRRFKNIKALQKYQEKSESSMILPRDFWVPT